MFIDIVNQPEKEIIPGYRAKFLHTQHMTLVYWQIKSCAPIPAHSHSHEQTVNMIAGKFNLTIGGVTRIMMPGDVAVIPPNVLHSGYAETDCQIIDVFYPIREDYIFDN